MKKLMFVCLGLIVSLTLVAQEVGLPTLEEAFTGLSEQRSTEAGEIVLLEHFTHLNSPETSKSEWKVFRSHTDLDSKLEVVPDLGIKAIYDIARMGALALRLGSMAAEATMDLPDLSSAQQMNELIIYGASPSLMAEGIQTLADVVKDTKNLYEIAIDFKDIQDGPKPGAEIVLLDANYQPLTQIMKYTEILKVLDYFTESRESKYYKDFRSLIMTQLFSEFVLVSRQADGLARVIGGPVLANDFISITAFAMQDLPLTTRNEMLSFFKEQTSDLIKKEKRKYKEQRESEINQALEKLNESFKNVEKLQSLPENSGKLVAVGFLGLALLQSEARSVDKALSMLEETGAALEKMGVKPDSHLGMLGSGVSQTAKFLGEAGDTSGDWMMAGVRLPQLATNKLFSGVATSGDFIAARLSGASDSAQEALKSASLATQAASDSVSKLAGSAADSSAEAAKKLFDKVKTPFSKGNKCQDSLD